MKKRFGRVLALILAMSLIMANVCAASATDSQAGATEPAVQESVSEGNLEEGLEVLPEDTPTAESTEKQEDTETAKQPEKSEAAGSKEQSKSAEEEQNTAKEETSTAEENAVVEAAKELRYENEEVTVVVSAEQEEAIPEGVSLKVVPVTAKDNATKAQYEEVKKQLQTKVSEEDKDIAGFLAYDITFVDAQGNEVEPNGSVKVSMEYKKGVTPEGLSEADAKDADMTVYHLEEDENGNVKDVVDMGAAKQVKDLSTTDKNEIKKLEVQTESFSVFTIVWKDGVTQKKLEIQVVNEAGKSIGNVGEHEFELNKEYSVERIAEEISVPNGYHFKQAKLGRNFEDANTSVLRLRNYRERVQRKNQYSSAASGNTWKDVGDNQIYFIFEFEEERPPLATIKTEDTSNNIDITLYDYEESENLNSGRKDGLIFNPGADGEKYNKWIGYWGNGYGGENDSYAVQGIVDKQLRNQWGRTVDDYIHYDGQLYPKLNVGSKNVLTDLFSEKHLVASDLNHLFVKDENGYYSYNSAENYAYYNKKGKDFVVYNQPFDKGKDGKGDFMPLTTYNDSSKFYYGMTVGFNFIQPTGGLIDGKPMKFEFSGDDDVWVFIDGQLVLDIGGIHGATSGSIDFATGDVKVGGVVKSEESGIDGGLGKTTTLQNIFGLDNKTFDKHTEHRLEFIYLERGAGESNCNLKFNIQTIPEGVTVQKQIDNYDEGAYTDVEFQFKLYLQDSKDLTKFNQVTAGEYEVKRSGTSKGEIRKLEDSGGIFKLKHDEMAVFEELAEKGTKYYVEEIGMNQDEYDDVVITGSDVTDEFGKIDYTGDKTDVIARSKELIIGKNPYIVFHNRCAATNMKQLKITKKLQEGVSSDQEFEVQVTVGGKPYNGEYLRGPNGKKESTINGIIKIKPNEIITVLGNVKTEDGGKEGFPSGTSFEVQEINYDSNTYRTPIYEIESGTVDDPLTDGKASGKFNKEKNANVTITNILKESEKPEEVPHSKTIDYLGDGEKNTDTELTGEEFYRLYLDVTGIPSVKPDPADIVLVLDYSSSMSKSYEGYGTRFKGVKAAAKIAINTLLPEDTENRVGVVWFDEWVNENDIIPFTDNRTTLIKNIESKKYDSGTNYQAAFKNAQKLLENESEIDRKKFVIFVTDGEPYQWVENGHVGSGSSKEAKLHAAEEVRNFKDLSGFYAVSVGPDTGKEFLKKDIVGNAPAPLKDTLEANNKTELENAFGKVLGSITKQIGNVTITDELTEYVQFAGEDGVEYAGNQSGTQSDVADNLVSLKVTVRDKNAPADQAEEYKGNYTWSIDGKKVTVSFGNDFFLERDKIYSISFNVKLTDKAYQSYENNQEYPNVGDAGTDYLNNATSSEKPGFYSNKEATVSYKRVVIRSDSVVEQTETQQYAKPVVQVSSKKDWQMIKVSDSTDALKLKGAEFTFTKDDKVYVGISDENGQIEWTIDNQPIDEKDIPAGTYILEETKAPAGYMKSDDSWTVVISNTEPPTVTSNNSNKELDVKDEDGDGVYEIEISNKPLFELPSNGGNGIYWYMVGGVLLLTAAGMLILYKNKRKEVLGS